MGRRTWVRIFCDKWLRGSIRQEPVEVRAIFIDLLAMAGDSVYGDIGEIKLAKLVGFSDEVIAGVLNVPVEVWKKAKEKLIESSRIEVKNLNIGFMIRVINWKKYQSEYQRQRPSRKKVTPKVTHKVTPEVRKERVKSYKVDIDIDKDKDIDIDKEKKEKRGKVSIPYSEIIEDLNFVLHTSYKPTTKVTCDLIKARWNEGFRLDDFKRVHRKMWGWWGADVKMRPYLRPQTLYNNKFESYLNMPPKPSLSGAGVKAMGAVADWLRDEKEKEVKNVE